MARRKKNMTYEEELTYLDSEISKTEETLKALKTRKKELGIHLSIMLIGQEQTEES